MSKAWPMIALGEIARPVIRPIAVIPGQLYRTIGVKWWGEGAYERETIDGSRTAAKTLSIVRCGDFIINKIWVRHGSTAIASDDVDGCAASGEFPTFELDQARVLSRWIHWQTKTRDFWTKCDNLSRGSSGKNRIKPELFLTIKIPLPPLGEQWRIVARIEELTAKIEEVRSLRQESAESVFALIASLHLNLSGERIVSLKDFLRLDEEREEIEYGKEYPQVGVKGFGQGLFARETLNASQTTYKAFNRLYEGAVVLSQVKGWEGALAICPSDLAGRYVSPEYRTFRCTPEEALPKYLGAIFSTPWFWTRLSSLSRGVGGRRERIRPEHFLGLEIPMPTVGQQKQAVSVFEALEKVRSLQIESAAELDALLPAILDKAFKGEL
jgi:type I restriction enzyme S subunit